VVENSVKANQKQTKMPVAPFISRFNAYGTPALACLTELSLRLSYRTGRDDLVRDFFIPCLECSVLYRRAAGYFSSAGLSLAARGVASLASRRGRMQLKFRGCSAYAAGEEALDLVRGGIEVESRQKAL
jgi:hypothetical protein